MLNIYKTTKMKKNFKQMEYNPQYKTHKMHINTMNLITGMTGAGKSNFIINYILQMHDTFNHIYIYTKKPDEDLYTFLKSELKKDVTLDSIDNLPSLSDIKHDKLEQKLIIFDDFITSSKEIMQKLETYAIMARKSYFTCFFLTQKYCSCPLKIREQIRYLMMLKSPDAMSLRNIITRVDSEISRENIEKIIRNATKFKLNSCIIDLQAIDENEQFRRNFTNFYKVVDDNGKLIKDIEMYRTDGIIN